MATLPHRCQVYPPTAPPAGDISEFHELETLEYDPLAPKAFIPHVVPSEVTPRKVVVERCVLSAASSCLPAA